MPTFLEQLKPVLARSLGVPLFLLLVLSMMVVPVPPLLLDAFFSFNIALSLVILLAVIYVLRPLEFSVFPTVLLVATLLRLALNVASTRVVLLEGHTGPDAAGKVIEAFANFVVGGNFAVGLVVFVILMIINFVVVTKGAGRVSEVSARFTLDAMPGKQMAIDADLNAGLITAEEARSRREEVRMEADFYGSMDGASKFVRGDAIAGMLILFINILGGLYVGAAQHGMPLGEAARVYALLTIGDGLVAQIPALLLSTAVAVIVTRMSKASDMRAQMMGQILAKPQVLGIAAGILGVMGIVPGMPNFAFLLLAAICGAGAWFANRRQGERAASEQAAEQTAPPELPPANRELSWDDLAPVEPISLEIGYRLVPLVETADGGANLMARIKAVRRKLSQEMGFLVPAVQIRDNLELSPGAYRISLHGVPVAEGEIHPDKELAINPGRVFGALEGIATRDPAFGLDAVWIAPARRDHAQTMGYTVVDPSTVLATHLSHVIQQHGHELLGHEEVQQLLDVVARNAPRLVEDLVPNRLPLAVVAKVFQGLLREGVSVRNLRGILEALADASRNTQDPDQLLAAVRVALGRQIVQDIAGQGEELPVITLDPRLEQILLSAMQGGEAALEPGLADRIHQALAERVEGQEAGGEPAVLLVPPALRPVLSRFTRHSLPALKVLAFNEVPEHRQLRMVASVGA